MADGNDTGKLSGWGVRVDWACKACGKVTRSKPSMVGTYCSKSCATSQKTRTYSVPLVPCAACSKPFRPRLSGGCRPKTCGEHCRKVASTLARILVAAEKRSAATLVRLIARTSIPPRLVEPKPGRHCIACGCALILKAKSPARWCKACRPEALKQSRDAWNRSAKGVVLQRKHRSARRAKQRGAGSQSIDPIAVFERDGWRCKICARRTPRAKRGTIDGNAPELDHIVPLSRGGAHTWGNVQCTCRRCNQAKGATAFGQIGFDWAA